MSSSLRSPSAATGSGDCCCVSDSRLESVASKLESNAPCRAARAEGRLPAGGRSLPLSSNGETGSPHPTEEASLTAAGDGTLLLLVALLLLLPPPGCFPAPAGDSRLVARGAFARAAATRAASGVTLATPKAPVSAAARLVPSSCFARAMCAPGESSSASGGLSTPLRDRPRDRLEDEHSTSDSSTRPPRRGNDDIRKGRTACPSDLSFGLGKPAGVLGT